MEENTVDTNTLRKKNMEIFGIGTALVVLISMTLTCYALYSFVLEYPGAWVSGGYFTNELRKASMGGGLNMYLALAMWYVLFILGVLFVQICIYFGVRVFTSQNKEISGIKLLIFFAFELLVAFTPFLIIWASNYV